MPHEDPEVLEHGRNGEPTVDDHVVSAAAAASSITLLRAEMSSTLWVIASCPAICGSINRRAASIADGRMLQLQLQ